MADGTRTRDHRDHNPGLYQLSYRHRGETEDSSCLPQDRNPQERIPIAGIPAYGGAHP